METKFIKTLNKSEAGFHLLMLLSLADNHSVWPEHKVVLDFLDENYSEQIDLIKEQAFINALPAFMRKSHFEEVAQRFFSISTIQERFKFTGFAVDVIMADKILKNEENEYLNILYDNWDLE